MSPKRAEIPEECFDCPLPDCHETDPRCPLLRRKAEEKGVTLPLPENAPSVRRSGRRNEKHEGIVPAPATVRDRREYHQVYNKEYSRRFRRIVPPGVKVRRCDIEILEKVAAAEGRTFAEEITMLIEIMAENARARGWS